MADPTSPDFRTTPLDVLASGVVNGRWTARSLAELALARIEQRDGALHSFVAVDADAALRDAEEIDARVRAGDTVGPLAGVPLAVKDLEDARGYATSKGSALFTASPPAERDSELVARLRRAGCVVVGKTNTPELGHKADTVNPAFGATFNPWDLARSPGGSSGGSAAAVAGGLVPLATASDGGGSIRIPAALCGLPGFKPSLGRVPGGPGAPDWPLLSTKGVLAASVADTALALDCVVGPDPADLRSLPPPGTSWRAALGERRVPRRVAWSPTMGYAEPDREVREQCERAVAALADLGAEVVELDVFEADPVWTWVTLVAAYQARTLRSHRDGPQWANVDATLRAQVEIADRLTPADIAAAEDACWQLNARLVEIFTDFSLLLAPVTAAAAPLSGQPGVVNGSPDQNWVRYTYGFNCTRSPAGSVYAGLTSNGLPVGLQIVGPQHRDVEVLQAMALLEEAIGRPAYPDLGGHG